MEPGITYRGQDIANDKKTDVKDCAVWAKSRHAKFWTYNTDTTDCVLKDKYTAREPLENHISGSSGCAERVNFIYDIGQCDTYS